MLACALSALALLPMHAANAAKAKAPAPASATKKTARGQLVSLHARPESDATVIEVASDRPLSFTTLRLASPPRVVLDFPDTELRAPLPSAIIVTTAAMPIVMPMTVSPARSLLRWTMRSAIQIEAKTR